MIGDTPVIVGGLAVLARLSNPYRATVDLDVVDRSHGKAPHLEVLRAAIGATSIEPAAVLLPTRFGPVKVDVLEVRQIEIDEPSDDPGDRLHASSHAWASDSATEMVLEVVGLDGQRTEVVARVAEPGPLIAMKLQAVMNRSDEKQGTDLLDIIRITFDDATRSAGLAQLAGVADSVAQDIALHVDLWMVRRRDQALRLIRSAGGADIAMEDMELAAELLADAVRRPQRRRRPSVDGPR
ncbi:prevent-host-death protein [Nocardioides alcanivorans]|uniref:prevent-host-death protein n=1 Tax=Nocardioides alcanivorans TaxID=2897352 RepID=UPI001F3CB9E9|nr:prevent-host-death protein [Nocardioides alcanivorans]